MYTPPSASAGLEANITPVPSNRNTPAERRPQRNRPLMRKYEVACLDKSGDITDFNSVGPALPMFEDAFAALGRGSLLLTEDGPIAIEDLAPGTMVQTVDDGFQPVQWIGSTTLIPNVAGQPEEMGRLTRIAADSFGLSRPMPDLVLGPRARVFHKSTACRSLFGTEGALAMARNFIDGVNVIEVTPMTAVKAYHLAFKGHQMVRVNGLEIESYHPGRRPELQLSTEMLTLFMDLFPYMTKISEFGEVKYPQLSTDEFDDLRAA